MIDLARAKVIGSHFVGLNTPALGCFVSGDGFSRDRIQNELENIAYGSMHPDDRESIGELYFFIASQPNPLPLGHSDLHAQLRQTVSNLMDLQDQLNEVCIVADGKHRVVDIRMRLEAIINGLVDLVGAPEEDEG